MMSIARRQATYLFYYLSFLIISCIAMSTASTATMGSSLSSSPLVLIPGDGASVLETRFNKNTSAHWWCSKSTHGKWERLWIPNPTQLLPKTIDCWSETIRLHYEFKGKNKSTVQNADGVEIRPLEGSDGLELIAGVTSSNVYHDLLQHIPEKVYVATYDFRLSPAGNPHFLQELQQMIETAYEQSGRKKVTLASHSLGALWAHYFLMRHVSQEWKDMYINAWIPISPAHGGVIYSLKQLVSGDSVGIPWLHGKDLKEEQRSYEGSLWLLPSVQIYKEDVLVSLESTNQQYTSHDYQALFREAGFDSFNLQWDRVKDLTPWDNKTLLLADPLVMVYPIYGNGVETPVQYRYKSSLNEEPTAVTSPDGDGTVALASLQAGNEWRHAAAPLVMEGQSHTDILSHPNAIQHILDILAAAHGDNTSEA